MRRDPDAQTKLDEIVKDYGIVSDVPLPAFNCASVEGLKEHKDGLICFGRRLQLRMLQAKSDGSTLDFVSSKYLCAQGEARSNR